MADHAQKEDGPLSAHQNGAEYDVPSFQTSRHEKYEETRICQKIMKMIVLHLEFHKKSI